MFMGHLCHCIIVVSLMYAHCVRPVLPTYGTHTRCVLCTVYNMYEHIKIFLRRLFQLIYVTS